MKELITESLNLIANGVVITDPNQKDNPVVYVNKAFTKITGYDEKEAVGTNCRFLQGPNTKGPELDKLREAVRKRKSTVVVLKNYKKNKELFWNELYISPVTYKGKTYFIGIQNDVTARKRAEMQLEKYKEELEKTIDARTQKIREINKQLMQEIEENKNAREKIIKLNEKLMTYGNTRERKEKKEKLNKREEQIKQELLKGQETINEIQQKTNLAKSTISTIKKRLLEKHLDKIFLPNINIFNLITLVIYKNETPKKIPEETFIHIQGKDAGFYIMANKNWLDYNKSQKETELKTPEIHHFDPEQTEIEILGEREEKTKLNKKHIKTLYAICKYKNTAKASKMIGQTIQTTTKHINEIKKTTLKTKYYEKLEEQEAIELTTKKGNFFSIKDDTREFGINMLQGWLTIKEETELIIPINEAKTKIDFTNTIKHNYLIEE